MSAIMKLRQARNVEQIADQLEPLAQSLAALSDQAQANIRSLEDASRRQAQEWSSQQASAAREVQTAAQHVASHAQALQQAIASLTQTAREVQQAQSGQFWTLATVAGMSSILAAMLSTALWLWLAPVPEVRNTLDAKGVAEILKPAIQEALRRK